MIGKHRVWKKGFEDKGMKIHVENTKVIRCSDEFSVAQESDKFSCAICVKGVGSRSVRFDKGKIWVHKKCIGLNGRVKADQCTKYMVNGVTSVGAASGKKENLLLENGESVECVV